MYYFMLLVATLALGSCAKLSDYPFRPGAPAKQSAINTQNVFFTPTTSAEELDLQKAASVSIDKSVYYIGTEQVSAKNQNPIISCFDEAGQLLWSYNAYEQTAVDGRGLALTTDGTNLYAAFSADGGSFITPNYTDFTKKGWLPSYGTGGGASVVVLAKLNPMTGEPLTGTYVLARKSDGKTNTLKLVEMTLESDGLHVDAQAWYAPLNVQRQRISVSGTSPFEYSVRFNEDLTQALEANIKTEIK